MHGVAAELLVAALLVITLGTAVVRPAGVGEAVVAVPAAAVALLVGAVPLRDAGDAIVRIGPAVGYLAAILAFGALCARAGLFAYLGSLAARAAGDGTLLLPVVVLMAAGVTAVLTLDATVVLFTPIAIAAARAARLPVQPFAFACLRLANSSSVLLPVSNLTNLLAFAACGLSFARFTSLMLLPWLVVVAAEWALVWLRWRAELTGPRAADVSEVPCAAGHPPVPRYTLAVLAVTVAGFVLLPTLGYSPAWAAAAGCLALLTYRRTARAGLELVALLRSAQPGFCVFVLALAVLVDGLARHGLGDAIARLLPNATAWIAIVSVSLLAALLANVVNNLPAVLLLVPLLAGQPVLLLAALLGVNIGPNAAYPGSLATLLWRRLVPRAERPGAAQFHALGLGVAPLLVAAASALWLAARVVGV